MRYNKVTVCLPKHWRDNVDLFCEKFKITQSELLRRSIKYTADCISTEPYINWRDKFKKCVYENKRFRGLTTGRLASVLLPHHIDAVDTQCRKFNASVSKVIRFDLWYYISNIEATDQMCKGE